MLTWDDHRLATHDEDDLHGAELRHPKPLALQKDMAELECEDCAVGPDGDGECDVRIIYQSVVRFHALILQSLLVGDDHDSEAVADSDKSSSSSTTHNDPFLQYVRGDADDPDLKAERD